MSSKHLRTSLRTKMATPASEYFRKVPYKQDLPPSGGYAKLVYEKKLPTRGPSGIAIMLGGLGVMALGWTQIISWNRKARDLGREQAVARLSLLPLLQAEQDRINMKKMKDNLEMERLIMADVPDWEVGKSVYYTDRWVHPKTIQNIEE